ncbi:SH3 domain-containing protein [Pseudomonas sp. o96-267]|uniref:SH3 domain-containing protein n=1 Tax=Pseudomonas sp. o96-267 TaxID=2479853 RepID=UPI000F776BDF|nr:SH3 domain-containing protein [Pseudomonas sp. o96-267]RRV40873.1 SH3 domain-containing protein [Pseudomonas sp. o96-267]
MSDDDEATKSAQDDGVEGGKFSSHPRDAALAGDLSKVAFASAKAFELSPSMKATIDAAKVFEQSTSMKAIAAAAKAFELSPSMKATIDAAKVFEQSTSMKAMVAAAKVLADTDSSLLAPDKWWSASTLALNEVVHEFVARATDHVENTPVPTDQPQPDAGVESALGISDSFYGEVVLPTPPSRPLVDVPTWVLIVWMWVFLPTLLLIANWESAREGLADLNARLPQTESLANVRNFIRTELAGKPGDFRLVTGSNVRLRAAPGMKSDVLLLLPRDSVVVVHGKEGRTWRLVSYEHQGYMIEGYVSTAYLKKVKR